MILRSLASLVVVGLLALNWLLPSSAMSSRGPENQVRADFETQLAIGRAIPELELMGFDGRQVTRDDLLGRRVLITFERSVDW